MYRPLSTLSAIVAAPRCWSHARDAPAVKFEHGAHWSKLEIGQQARQSLLAAREIRIIDIGNSSNVRPEGAITVPSARGARNSVPVVVDGKYRRVVSESEIDEDILRPQRSACDRKARRAVAADWAPRQILQRALGARRFRRNTFGRRRYMAGIRSSRFRKYSDA